MPSSKKRVYRVMGHVDATVLADVRAATPEAAIEAACGKDAFSPSLCHQCSDVLEVADVVGYTVLLDDQEVYTDFIRLEFATDEQLAAEIARRAARKEEEQNNVD